jgi:uncharacterized membrane protein
MISYESQITIERPTNEVFSYVTTFENFPQWTDTNQVTRISPDREGVGGRLLIDMGKGPFRHQAEYETVAWDPNRRWAFRTAPGAPIGWEGSFVFESSESGATKVTSTGHVSLRGWRRLLTPLARMEISHSEKAELETLKSLLEGAHQARP